MNVWVSSTLNWPTHLFKKVQIIVILFLYHNKILASSYQTVQVVISIIMDDRACSSWAHPKVSFMNVIKKCTTQQTWWNLSVRKQTSYMYVSWLSGGGCSLFFPSSQYKNLLICQIILACWLVFTYDLLEDRCIGDVIIFKIFCFFL